MRRRPGDVPLRDIERTRRASFGRRRPRLPGPSARSWRTPAPAAPAVDGCRVHAQVLREAPSDALGHRARACAAQQLGAAHELGPAALLLCRPFFRDPSQHLANRARAGRIAAPCHWESACNVDAEFSRIFHTVAEYSRRMLAPGNTSARLAATGEGPEFGEESVACRPILIHIREYA